MAKKDKKSSPKVDDVSKPGETPASPNARPTITGHSPAIKNDPMVAFSSKKEDEEPIKQSDAKESYLTKTKAKIDPISKDVKPDEDKKEEDTSTEDQKPENEPGKDNNTDKPAASDSAAIDALAETADAKKVESKEEEEEKKHKEYIGGLVKSEKYRLPIIEGGHKASAERFVSWIFLLLLIASIAVYLAIDAGYIKIGFDLPFEFIKD